MPARPAAFPANEAERVATLHRLEILDTLPERAYDDLTLLASQICGTPIALVALIDTHRQWYKSVVGTTLKETSRNEAFCAHAILKPDDVLVIEDAADDPRFVDNAFVTGEPHIRFYAGAPIVMASGEAIGAMCVIDTKPRAMTAALGECLRALARQAALLLDLREKAIVSERIALESEKTTVEARLKQKRGLELLELVLRGGQMGLWDLDIVTGRWTVNAREQMMLGYAAVDSADADTDWRSLIHPDDWPMLNAAMEPHLNGRASFYECTHRMRHADGHYLWVLDRGVIVERNVRGEATRLVGTHVDVTESRRREEEQRRGAERLELALSSGEQGLWDWDIVGGEVVRTEKWARLFGYTAGEMEREARTGAFRSRQLVHPDDLDAWRTARDRHLSGLTPTFEIEVRMRRRDGRIIWVLERGKVVERDALGRALRAVGTTTDITDRKNNELALRRASELLISIGAMARVGGWSIDIESSAVFWTDEIYRIHDLNPAERPTLAQAIGFFTPGCRPVLEAAIDAAIAHGTRWDLELSLISARGRLVWIRTLGKVESKDGKAARLVGTAQDITDRRQAETLLVENERQLRLITDSLPALVAHVDTDQRYTFVNNSVESVFGVTRESVIGKTMHELRDDATYATMAPHIARALAGERASFESFSEVRGRPYYYQTHYVPDVDAQGTVRGFYSMTFDITERKRAEIRRAESEERLRGITDNIPAMIAEIDIRGRFRFANETYRTWLGVDPAAIVGAHLSDAISAEYYEGRREQFERARRGEQVSFEQSINLPGGVRCLHTTYLPHFDAAGAIAGIYALTNDITELKETQERLDTLARFDPLTGLANRRQLQEKIAEAMARTRRSARAMAVLYLDIDRFKAINDTLGHAAGDAVLVEFARRLKAAVREVDLVARHGGDEFVVVLEGIADDEEAQAIGDKLVATMRPAFALSETAPDETVDVTTSVGVATFSGGPLDVSVLLARADRALYDAKSRGRDRVMLAVP